MKQPAMVIQAGEMRRGAVLVPRDNLYYCRQITGQLLRVPIFYRPPMNNLNLPFMALDHQCGLEPLYYLDHQGI